MAKNDSPDTTGTDAGDTTIDKETVEAAAKANEPAPAPEGPQNPLRSTGDGETSSTPESNTVETKVDGDTYELSTQEASQLNALPTRLTAKDAQGIDRVIVPTTDPWKPNPIEPDADEVERLEQRSKLLEAKRKESLKALGVDA